MVVMLSYVEMLHPLLTGGEMRLHPIPQRIKGDCIEFAVDAAPLDRFFARGLSNDISVRWDRPVLCPVSTRSAPVSVKQPSFRSNAISISWAAVLSCV